MGLFLTAGLGSGSTFQMIAVIFRQITIYRVKMKGGSDEQTQKVITETAAALGFISAIGAVGGFFIPQAFGMSLDLTGSPVGAMKVFLIFYIVCVLLTWLVYGQQEVEPKIRDRCLMYRGPLSHPTRHQIPIRWSRSNVMSKLLDRFRYFKQKGETFADGHGQVMHSNRDWEDSYRQRWQFDKIVRSTHGVNCTGSCSRKSTPEMVW